MPDAMNWRLVNELMPALLERQKDRVHAFQLGSKKMAIAFSGEAWRAFPARCPHSGGPLGSGWVADGAVVCPWHRFAFDIETGQCRNAGYAIRSYDVKIEDGRVWIAIPKKKWWEF